MIRKLLPLLLPLALLLGGCLDRELPTAPAAAEAPGLVIADAPRGGRAGFYFLPPMVADPGPFTEPFDPSRSPTAHVCLLSQAPCTSGNSLATFNGSSQAAALTVDLEGQSYNAVWHTPGNLTLGRDMYRLEVYDGAVRLGYADLEVVSRTQDLKRVTGGYVGLVRGSPFQIKFRLEGEREQDPEILAETISGGFLHSCGLTASGAAYCWGANLHGQLGEGTTTGSATPVPVQMPEGVTFTSISAGSGHTVALTPTGAAYAWGQNWSGELGDGTLTDRTTPVPVQMPDGVAFTSISAGHTFVVALSTTGVAYAWGNGGFGRLGDGSMELRTTPVPVQMPEGVTFTSISAGQDHAAAVSGTGAIYTWGWNSDGQLGNETMEHSATPVVVQTPTGVTFTAVGAGAFHTVALTSSGAVYAWGNNSFGQLGNGTTTGSASPVAVEMPEGVSLVTIHTGWRHNVALSSTGAAYAWGENTFSQLGDGTTAASRTTPVAVQIPDGVTFRFIARGFYHTLALSPTGVAYAWGNNSFGQLGDGTSGSGVTRNTPVAVVGGITFQVP